MATGGVTPLQPLHLKGNRMYIVSLREGSMCQAQGLQVEFNGAYAHVHCTLNQREKFWAIRLEFLRSNPNN